MRKSIEEKLRASRRTTGALPSIRELARHHGAAPLTVHRALRQLAREGLVHAVDRKGYFWGAEAHAEKRPSISRDERFTARFLADLHQGAYHPWKELPSRTALGEIYGTSSRSVGRLLFDLAERDLLVMRGRRFFPAASSVKKPGASVLLIGRCNAQGEFLLDTEREIDFIKSVRRELSERDMGMIRIGYCEESGGRFLDPSGREIHATQWPGPLVGILISTWLLQDPSALLRRLERLRLPISVWWEHPESAFPRHRGFKGGLAGFNLSFGASAGLAVGRHLASRGQLEARRSTPMIGRRRGCGA